MKDKILVSIKNTNGNMIRYKLYGSNENLCLEYVDKYYHVESYVSIVGGNKQLILELAKKAGILVSSSRNYLDT